MEASVRARDLFCACITIGLSFLAIQVAVKVSIEYQSNSMPISLSSMYLVPLSFQRVSSYVLQVQRLSLSNYQPFLYKTGTSCAKAASNASKIVCPGKIVRPSPRP